MDFNVKAIADFDTAQGCLAGLVWSIFFHRLFGNVVPRYRTFLGVKYPSVEGYDTLDDTIALRGSDLFGKIMKLKQRQDLGTQPMYRYLLKIRFYDKEMRCWEKWQLALTVLDNQDPRMVDMDQETRRKFYREDFERNLFKILEFVDSNKDHVPPLPSTEMMPFPYDITLEPNLASAPASGSGSSESMEYITTTDAGDIIMGDTRYSTAPGARIPSGEELLRNGYNFFKKFLE